MHLLTNFCSCLEENATPDDECLWIETQQEEKDLKPKIKDKPDSPEDPAKNYRAEVRFIYFQRNFLS